MNNKDLNSPTMRPSAGYAFDADLSTKANGEVTLRGLDIQAPGKLFFIDIDGNSANYDFSGLTAGIPYRFIMQIKKIVGDGSGAAGNGTTGTDIALANLKPIR